MKTLLGLLVVLAVLCTGCKVDNRKQGPEYKDSDYIVACVYGHKYLMDGWQMAPKFDPVTHLPEACEVQK